MEATVSFTLALEELKTAYGYGLDAPDEEVLSHLQLAVLHGRSVKRLLTCDRARIRTVKGECQEYRR